MGFRADPPYVPMMLLPRARQGLLRLIKLIGGEEKCEDPVTVSIG